MRHLLLSYSLVLLLSVTAVQAIPLMDVAVADANNHLAFRGATQPNGTFATGTLRPGSYVVQFRSKQALVQGEQFMLIVIAGKKPLISNAVAGEKFATRSGVAVNVEVAPGMKITGQVESARALERDKIKVVNGKRYFFVAETGTNLGGHWVEEDETGARQTYGLSRDSLRKLQDSAGEGSMIGNMHREALENGHH